MTVSRSAEPADLAIRSTRIVMPTGMHDGWVIIRDGRIEEVSGAQHEPTAIRTIDAGECVVLPGFVDSHVHINEPGHTEWEGFETATRAAAAGGITTIVDMPLNSVPVTTTRQALEAKTRAIEGRCTIDVGLWGGLIPDNAGDLDGLIDAGALGIKCFLVHSGLDEFPCVGEHELRLAMPLLARLGVPLLVHAESPADLRELPEGQAVRSYQDYMNSRPPESELRAIEMLIGLAEETGCHVHIVHLAAACALESIRQAKARGVSITVETCPHYLTFTSEQIEDGATQFKCAPPIRSAADREALWQALQDGTIDLVASDHSPCPPELKRLDRGDFATAWGGIASLQFGLSIMLSGAAARQVPIGRVASWMSWQPAQLAGLASRKGAIRPGYDADLVIVDTNTITQIEPDMIFHRHALTPYSGTRCKGRVVSTFVRGHCVFDRGRHTGSRPGIWLSREMRATQ